MQRLKWEEVLKNADYLKVVVKASSSHGNTSTPSLH